MRWRVLAVIIVCGLLLVHQVSLSHRLRSLESERDQLRTDLQSQNEQLQTSLQEARKTAALHPENHSFARDEVSSSSALPTDLTPQNSPAQPGQAQSSNQSPNYQSPNYASTQSSSSGPRRPTVPEYNPYNPVTPTIEETPTQEIATNDVTKRSWGPEQIIGPPDTDRSGDLPTAWATLDPDRGDTEWLWAGFDRPVSVAEVRIRESFNPGAISKVTARVGDQEVVLWEGTAAGGRAPRDFVVPVSQNLNVQNVVVYLDSNRVAGWNEIDAVELVARDGSRQWASSANASSTYAERIPIPFPSQLLHRSQ